MGESPREKDSLPTPQHALQHFRTNALLILDKRSGYRFCSKIFVSNVVLYRGPRKQLNEAMLLVVDFLNHATFLVPGNEPDLILNARHRIKIGKSGPKENDFFEVAARLMMRKGVGTRAYIPFQEQSACAAAYTYQSMAGESFVALLKKMGKV